MDQGIDLANIYDSVNSTFFIMMESEALFTTHVTGIARDVWTLPEKNRKAIKKWWHNKGKLKKNTLIWLQ